MPHSIAKRVLLFWGIGIVIAAIIFGLSSAKPSIFGLFTLPFWILPALAGFGAHDNVMPLGLFGASLFYGVVAFLVFRVFVRQSPQQNSK